MSNIHSSIKTATEVPKPGHLFFYPKNRCPGKVNKGLFCLIKDKVLGKEYILSVAFVGRKKIQSLNNKFREKNSPTDILSFPLEKNSGEIIFCFDEIKRKSKLFGKTPIKYLNFLFIHGLLHLKGMEHSSKMESEERKLELYFKNNEQDNHQNFEEKNKG